MRYTNFFRLNIFVHRKKSKNHSLILVTMYKTPYEIHKKSTWTNRTLISLTVQKLRGWTCFDFQKWQLWELGTKSGFWRRRCPSITDMEFGLLGIGTFCLVYAVCLQQSSNRKNTGGGVPASGITRHRAQAIGNVDFVDKRRLIAGKILTTRNLLLFFNFNPFLTLTKHLSIIFIVF